VSGAVRVGQVGLGYWGRNLARVFDDVSDLRWLCDASEPLREEFARRFPTARVTGDFEEMISSGELDAVVIATPVPTHYPLARAALQAGLNVFVEKPPAMRVGEMEELIGLAEAGGLVLMPGHLLLYHPVILYLIQEEIVEAAAHGHAFLNEGVEDVVFCYLRFASGKIAHMHLSWLDPHKMRRLTVVGRDKMAVFDDMELDRKITVYDKAPEQPSDSYGEWRTRTGDIFSPKVSNDEPLKLECQHFVRLVQEGWDGREMHDGLEVVRALELLTESLRG
jgi:predicted dehydrogenase